MPFQVEVRVTARYFVEVDDECAADPGEAKEYVDGLSDSEVMESIDHEVDEVEILDAWPF
jgi:hypothetical protein